MVKVKGTGWHKMRSASWIDRATAVVTEHIDTKLEHTGSLSTLCSVNVHSGSVIRLCDDGDVRVLDG